MHRHLADRIEAGDGEPVRIARANLARWENRWGELPPALREWVELLAWPTSRFVSLLREETENATRIRSSSPFAGAIDQRLRLELLRAARAA
ncbi:MAG TPA: hypothetical protein VJ696_12215 [Rhodanobacteraceae bacterium]|nr:hypothetical protein [Rhodanobacteraceae bacterium]